MSSLSTQLSHTARLGTDATRSETVKSSHDRLLEHWIRTFAIRSKLVCISIDELCLCYHENGICPHAGCTSVLRHHTHLRRGDRHRHAATIGRWHSTTQSSVEPGHADPGTKQCPWSSSETDDQAKVIAATRHSAAHRRVRPRAIPTLFSVTAKPRCVKHAPVRPSAVLNGQYCEGPRSQDASI